MKRHYKTALFALGLHLAGMVSPVLGALDDSKYNQIRTQQILAQTEYERSSSAAKEAVLSHLEDKALSYHREARSGGNAFVNSRTLSTFRIIKPYAQREGKKVSRLLAEKCVDPIGKEFGYGLIGKDCVGLSTYKDDKNGTVRFQLQDYTGAKKASITVTYGTAVASRPAPSAPSTEATAAEAARGMPVEGIKDYARSAHTRAVDRLAADRSAATAQPESRKERLRNIRQILYQLRQTRSKAGPQDTPRAEETGATTPAPSPRSAQPVQPTQALARVEKTSWNEARGEYRKGSYGVSGDKLWFTQKYTGKSSTDGYFNSTWQLSPSQTKKIWGSNKELADLVFQYIKKDSKLNKGLKDGTWEFTFSGEKVTGAKHTAGFRSAPEYSSVPSASPRATRRNGKIERPSESFEYTKVDKLFDNNADKARHKIDFTGKPIKVRKAALEYLVGDFANDVTNVRYHGISTTDQITGNYLRDRAMLSFKLKNGRSIWKALRDVTEPKDFFPGQYGLQDKEIKLDLGRKKAEVAPPAPIPPPPVPEPQTRPFAKKPITIPEAPGYELDDNSLLTIPTDLGDLSKIVIPASKIFKPGVDPSTVNPRRAGKNYQPWAYDLHKILARSARRDTRNDRRVTFKGLKGRHLISALNNHWTSWSPSRSDYALFNRRNVLGRKNRGNVDREVFKRLKDGIDGYELRSMLKGLEYLYLVKDNNVTFGQFKKAGSKLEDMMQGAFNRYHKKSVGRFMNDRLNPVNIAKGLGKDLETIAHAVTFKRDEDGKRVKFFRFLGSAANICTVNAGARQLAWNKKVAKLHNIGRIAKPVYEIGKTIEGKKDFRAGTTGGNVLNIGQILCRRKVKKSSPTTPPPPGVNGGVIWEGNPTITRPVIIRPSRS
ncbi:hypothetical protein KY328_05815 [Candidatus Woesearchaeota archaeon]|nr:hypothetical protein [Candidatus Woesearchaeota archaeon]MBW3022416.1 hypothetical protein [Candidatus Woesearchaeota archaeon]